MMVCPMCATEAPILNSTGRYKTAGDRRLGYRDPNSKRQPVPRCDGRVTSAPRASEADYVADGLRAWMQQYHVPTSSLAVMQDGALIGSFGYGGWEPEQKHRLASLSKAITGVCIARLAQPGVGRGRRTAILTRIRQRTLS